METPDIYLAFMGNFHLVQKMHQERLSQAEWREIKKEGRHITLCRAQGIVQNPENDVLHYLDDFQTRGCCFWNPVSLTHRRSQVNVSVSNSVPAWHALHMLSWVIDNVVFSLLIYSVLIELWNHSSLVLGCSPA